MDLQQLKYFLSVSQTLNFSEAAKRHFMTQPAVSRQITKLENELNVKLFFRSSHKVALTDAGKEFYKYALDILDVSEKAASQMHIISNEQAGILRISSIACPTHSMIQALSMFTKQHPGVRIDLDVATGLKQIMSIQKDEYDIYFATEALLKAQDSLIRIPTDEERCFLLVHKRDAPYVDVTDFSGLEGKTLICEYKTEGPNLFGKISEICRNRNFDVEYEGYLPLTSVFAVTMAVSAGIGFTIIPESIAKGTSSEYLVYLPIPGDDALIQYAVGWNPLKNSVSKDKFLHILGKLFPNISMT